MVAEAGGPSDRSLGCLYASATEVGMAGRDLARALWRFSWRWLPGAVAAADDALISQCASLFSSDYARWGRTAGRPGERVRISPSHIRRLLDSKDAHFVCALDDSGVLAGYAIVLRFRASDGRRVAWIAQLVVRESYRQARVATTMLFSAWQFSDYDAWGLVTANPYAVRALETATRRPCRGGLIVSHGDVLLHELRKYLTYLPTDFDRLNGRLSPTVDTRFPIDLSELPKMRDRAGRAARPWNLGTIEEGHEWFAATFASQPPSVARGAYLEELLEGMDAIWIRAYEGMTLDEGHTWHRHAAAEVDWLLDRHPLPAGASVLDAGCGDGRHSVLLAQRGLTVTGVDISPRLLERARSAAISGGADVLYFEGDLRDSRSLPSGPFDLVLCLYDVVGSSADPGDDRAILANLFSRTAPGGRLVLSVMSATSTLMRMPESHCPNTPEAFITALEGLPPSRRMETSGDIFHPALIVYFEGRFYRKEQFDQAVNLPPSELVIRDRRFAADQITSLVEAVGYRVVDAIGVRAGAWASPIAPDGPDSKEILVVAEVPQIATM